jgi:hypothetical protein
MTWSANHHRRPRQFQDVAVSTRRKCHAAQCRGVNRARPLSVAFS